MQRVLGALFDPAAQRGDLRGRQMLADRGRRHRSILGHTDAGDQFAFGRLAGDNGPAAAFQFFHGGIAAVQAQAGLAGRIIGAMTLKAIGRQDRPDVAVKIDGFRRLGADDDGNQQDRDQAEVTAHGGNLRRDECNRRDTVMISWAITAAKRRLRWGCPRCRRRGEVGDGKLIW